MLFVQIVAGILYLAGVAFLILALRRTFSGLKRQGLPAWRPPVTLMIPAHGAPPGLAECLRSVCGLDYPGLQVVFGLHAPDDAARPVIEAIMAQFPALDTALVIDGRRLGTNPKNANLANMLGACKHDILVMVDSDVIVPPDFLERIVAPLADPSVGGVTCLYSGLPQPGLASNLGALYHNDWFIPSALVDLGRREMDLCYGAAIAVTRRALDAIGGFEPMADAVAQDFVFGHELRRHGFAIRLADTVVATMVCEASLDSLIRHELRWNRAVRAVRPIDHALSIVMSSLAPLCLLLPSWPPVWALTALTLHLALRQVLHRLLRARFALPAPTPWLVPVREILNVVVWAKALLGRSVQWGNTIMITGRGLTMRRDQDHGRGHAA